MSNKVKQLENLQDIVEDAFWGVEKISVDMKNLSVLIEYNLNDRTEILRRMSGISKAAEFRLEHTTTKPGNYIDPEIVGDRRKVILTLPDGSGSVVTFEGLDAGALSEAVKPFVDNKSYPLEQPAVQILTGRQLRGVLVDYSQLQAWVDMAISFDDLIQGKEADEQE